MSAGRLTLLRDKADRLAKLLAPLLAPVKHKRLSQLEITLSPAGLEATGLSYDMVLAWSTRIPGEKLTETTPGTHSFTVEKERAEDALYLLELRDNRDRVAELALEGDKLLLRVGDKEVELGRAGGARGYSATSRLFSEGFGSRRVATVSVSTSTLRRFLAGIKPGDDSLFAVVLRRDGSGGVYVVTIPKVYSHSIVERIARWGPGGAGAERNVELLRSPERDFYIYVRADIVAGLLRRLPRDVDVVRFVVSDLRLDVRDESALVPLLIEAEPVGRFAIAPLDKGSDPERSWSTLADKESVASISVTPEIARAFAWLWEKYGSISVRVDKGRVTLLGDDGVAFSYMEFPTDVALGAGAPTPIYLFLKGDATLFRRYATQEDTQLVVTKDGDVALRVAGAIVGIVGEVNETVSAYFEGKKDVMLGKVRGSNALALKVTGGKHLLDAFARSRRNKWRWFKITVNPSTGSAAVYAGREAGEVGEKVAELTARIIGGPAAAEQAEEITLFINTGFRDLPVPSDPLLPEKDQLILTVNPDTRLISIGYEDGRVLISHSAYVDRVDVEVKKPVTAVAKAEPVKPVPEVAATATVASRARAMREKERRLAGWSAIQKPLSLSGPLELVIPSPVGKTWTFGNYRVQAIKDPGTGNQVWILAASGRAGRRSIKI